LFVISHIPLLIFNLTGFKPNGSVTIYFLKFIISISIGSTRIETGIGRFQFILGREIGVTLYGIGNRKDVIIVPVEDQTTLVNLKSTQLDFPIVEYRPFRTFSTDQSTSLVFQLTFGVDIPHGQYIIAPKYLQTPELKPIWYVSLRTAFDWRYYF